MRYKIYLGDLSFGCVDSFEELKRVAAMNMNVQNAFEVDFLENWCPDSSIQFGKEVVSINNFNLKRVLCAIGLADTYDKELKKYINETIDSLADFDREVYCPATNLKIVRVD